MWFYNKCVALERSRINFFFLAFIDALQLKAYCVQAMTDFHLQLQNKCHQLTSK